MTIPARLNGIIAAFERDEVAFVSMSAPEPYLARAIGDASYDGVVFEMEHNPYDIAGLKNCLLNLTNIRRVVAAGSVAPPVTPMVRIPPNGGEMNQWIAKQVLDTGVYGIIWPHVSTVEEARNAVAASRYARPPTDPLYEPAGIRGDSPRHAVRHWGVSQQEYYDRADVWPLNPKGEILVGIMCEEAKAVKNLPKILESVPGIGVVIIGEGDLSQDLGVPRQYNHPSVLSAVEDVLQICKEHNVACGHPHTTSDNVEELIERGFRWLMPDLAVKHTTLEKGIAFAGRQKTV